MPFIPAPFDSYTARIFQHFDGVCRNDLSLKLIVSERDYVSNLCTHIRYPKASLSHYQRLSSIIKSCFSAITSPANLEQKFGCDGIIVMSAKVGSSDRVMHKVGLFEAKWPRLSYPKSERSPWDNLKRTGSNVSRFSSQIERQAKLINSGIVIWEQFFSEDKISPSHYKLFNDGSTCVLLDDALQYMNSYPHLKTTNTSHKQWSDNDLNNLVSSYGKSFHDIIYQMASCRIGKPFLSERGEIIVAPTNSETSNTIGQGIIRIPLLSNAENINTVHNFLKENGLKFYTHIDLSNSETLNRVEESMRLYDVISQRRKLRMLSSK